MIDELESRLVIFYSGVERAASSVLVQQAGAIVENRDAVVERMHRIKALGRETKAILLAGELDSYGELLHEHWMQKRKLAAEA